MNNNGQGKNIIIGVFALVGLAIIVFILLFLHPSTGDEGQELHVRFSDIDKVTIGTRVLFAGKPVGEVKEIQEISTQERTGKADENDQLYAYELRLLLDSHLRVYVTDLICLRTSGLLGERSVAIIPVLPPNAQKPRLVAPNEVLYACAPGSVEETMKEFKKVVGKVDLALDQVSQLLDEVHKQELVKKIGETAQNMSEITAALNQPDELTAIITNLQEFTEELSKRLPESWDTLDETLAEFHTSAENVKNITSTFKTIATDVSEGKGSIGRLLVKDDIYLETQAILGKIDTLANDINHYGVLFHLDKGWQRLRARRLNLLQKLSTPQEFRNYFNDEMDQINASLSRVGMVLDNTESSYYPLCEDKEFTKVFAELLRRIAIMEESLKMYNQQVMDCEFKKTELTVDRY